MRLSNTLVLGMAGTAVASSALEKKSSTFTWFGSNESGAEFGTGEIPGTYGTDYTFPSTINIQVLIDEGMNIFRIPFLMERMVPTEMTGSIDSTYLSRLETVVSYITGEDAYAVICAQNFGRYYGDIINSTSNFEAFWKTVAAEFKSNSKVIFDTNNEYHDMTQSLVVELNQAAINGIRAAGATEQFIFVEGNYYTGAWTWEEYNTDMSTLTDTEDKIIYEMHQYLDEDGSGTSATCVSSTIGQERLESATAWLKAEDKKAILGEFAGGVNTDCKEAITGMLTYMQENSEYWKGAMWWSAGPWWGDYIFSMEPPDGTAYEGMLSTIKTYFP
ncbi:Cellulase [Penicillium taxi]|uniref:Cellulase n=1 Tax=Penicillium taxi TaxID=168475 RepID=UPI00254582BB|nr:Cellulase [Penicillium taxi]KAJ5895079.1 Cellulase [Penicillium taxi]